MSGRCPVTPGAQAVDQASDRAVTLTEMENVAPWQASTEVLSIVTVPRVKVPLVLAAMSRLPSKEAAATGVMVTPVGEQAAWAASGVAVPKVTPVSVIGNVVAVGNGHGQVLGGDPGIQTGDVGHGHVQAVGLDGGGRARARAAHGPGGEGDTAAEQQRGGDGGDQELLGQLHRSYSEW